MEKTKIKFLLLGNSSVGKSSIIKYYMDGKTATEVLSTIGVEYAKKELNIAGEKVDMEIWDTAG